MQMQLKINKTSGMDNSTMITPINLCTNNGLMFSVVKLQEVVLVLTELVLKALRWEFKKEKKSMKMDVLSEAHALSKMVQCIQANG